MLKLVPIDRSFQTLKDSGFANWNGGHVTVTIVYWSYIQWNSSNSVHFRKHLLHHHCTIISIRIQQQLEELTNEMKLAGTWLIIPSSNFIILTDTVRCIKCMDLWLWLTFGPIFKDQFSLTTCVNPWPSYCINTNPKPAIVSGVRFSKGNLSFSMDLVIERLSLGFEKTSSCESIPCCLFTEIFGISICFWVRIEAAGRSESFCGNTLF